MTYLALLRGINVGGRNIKMVDLKDCFESMGFAEVKTVLQSGNVVFSSDENPAKLKRKIESGLSETFHYPAKVWVLDTEELKVVIENNPFNDTPPDHHQYAIFFENDVSERFAAEVVEPENEAVQAVQDIVYWKVQKGRTLKSPRGKSLGKPRYRNYSTNRNINTIRKLYQLMLAPDKN
jgi:uncharacterized protein (DUF1697 family)